MTRASTILFWFGLFLMISLALYGTSNRVQEMNKQLRKINAQIDAEQANIHVLKAEWVYLANPERIEAAARKYLAMHPTAVNQITKLDDLAEKLPTAEEAQETGSSHVRAIASISRKVAENTKPEQVHPDKTYVNTHMHLPNKNETELTASTSHTDALTVAESLPKRSAEISP